MVPVKRESFIIHVIHSNTESILEKRMEAGIGSSEQDLAGADKIKAFTSFSLSNLNADKTSPEKVFIETEWGKSRSNADLI